MAIDYSKFDEKVDLDALQKEVAEAPDYADVPKGNYICTLDKMELVETKDGSGLNLAVVFKVAEGDHKGRNLQRYQKVCGNKTTEKWNDGRAIKMACDWLNEFCANSAIDVDEVEFVNYADFGEAILDIYQEAHGLQFDLDWDAKAFGMNCLKVNEAFD